MSGNSIPPWHMWGSESTTRVEITADVRNPQTTVQLARVHYKRPETWRFLIWAYLQEPTNAAAGTWDFQVEFQLTVGVGRSMVTLLLPSFRWDALTTTIQNGDPHELQRWTNCFNLKQIADSGLPPDGPNKFDYFVAQDIQLTALLHFAGFPDPGTFVTCNMGAFFSPEVHVRPDWFERDFSGDERHGR